MAKHGQCLADHLHVFAYTCKAFGLGKHKLTNSLFSNSAFLKEELRLAKSFSLTQDWKTLVRNCKASPV